MNPAQRSHGPPPSDFSRAPFLVIWESTQACDLACKHCRAEAQPCRHPEELTTAEARRMMDRLRCFGPIVFVFSGGDAMKRPDIVELVAHGVKLGLRVAITPATTALASREKLVALRDAGLSRLAVSLDGSNPGIHDAFRRVDGSFDHGVRILRTSQEIGLTTQVNTVVARHNLDDFESLCALMAELGIVFWEVFFLVPMGRARPEDVASAAEFEAVFHRLYDLAKTAPFDLRATAAPQFARVQLQRRTQERLQVKGHPTSAPEPIGEATAGNGNGNGNGHGHGHGHPRHDGIGRARGVSDGDGFLFVSHTGEIYPSGFLPISAGNVRRDDIVDVYQSSPLFRELRDRTRLKGKCRVCEFMTLCGGSRARAYAMTGDYLEAEPCCAHVPRRWQRMVERGDVEPADEYMARRIRHRGVALPVMG